jgi:hypothetical protein
MEPFIPPMNAPSERHTRCPRCGYRVRAESWAEPYENDPLTKALIADTDNMIQEAEADGDSLGAIQFRAMKAKISSQDDPQACQHANEA